MDTTSLSSMFHDAAHVKKKLDIALGRKADAYWTFFSAFIRGKKTKEEFDLVGKRLLGPLNVKLHNEFILTVMQSVESKSERVPSNQPSFPKKETVRDSSSWLSAFDKDVVPSTSLFSLSSDDIEKAALAMHRASPAPMTLSKLKAFTVVVAAENGMKSVEPIVHDILSSALGLFLKNMLEESMVCSGIYYKQHPQTNARFGFVRRAKKKAMLNPTHLHMACSMHPKLLGPIFKTFQETISYQCNSSILPLAHSHPSSSSEPQSSMPPASKQNITDQTQQQQPISSSNIIPSNDPTTIAIDDSNYCM
eukprot:m.54194 g.54194  ORF g.54194 m.54194 type:complete len:307 (-) comp7708_c0_seq2:154-1074(-)